MYCKGCTTSSNLLLLLFAYLSSYTRCARISSMNILHVDSTTATHCCTVLPTHYSGGCSPYRTLLPPDRGYTATGSHHSSFEGPPLAAGSASLLVCESLHGLAPSYLPDYCILASSDKLCRRLHLADVDTCIVPRTRTRFGDRSFPAARSGTACHWNCDGQTLSLANS